MLVHLELGRYIATNQINLPPVHILKQCSIPASKVVAVTTTAWPSATVIADTSNVYSVNAVRFLTKSEVSGTTTSEFARLVEFVVG